MANRWSKNGEIPKDWVEAVEPQPVRRSERGYRAMIVWQKAMAVFAWLFAGLFIVSIGFELIGNF